MERAQEESARKPTYLEFFGLSQPPFARLKDPTQVFQTEQYSLLTDHLANATERQDCLAVICGADGCGKTTLLNSYIATLDDDICFATIDETCSGEEQFYQSFLNQIGFSDITGTSQELRNITRQFLVNRGNAGDPVLIIIDNAHRASPTVLDQLRRIAAIKIKECRVISVVLAGNSHIVRVVDSPAMSQTKFSSHVHFNIRIYTEEETANYVWHHLWLAGGIDSVKIKDEAHPVIYRYTGGNPRLINKLCHEVLTEACAADSRVITEGLVRTVADKMRLLPHVVPLHGKGRRKTDSELDHSEPDETAKSKILSNLESVERLESGDGAPQVDGTNLLELISQLTEQIGDLKADKMRALEDLGTRDEDITELRRKLDLQAAETEKLAKALEDNATEIERQNQQLHERTAALQESEAATVKLATDLEAERNAAEAAQAEIAKAKAKTEELNQLRKELDAQTAKTEELASALENNATEIERQNQALSESTSALQESEDAAAKLAADLEKERMAAKAAQEDIARAEAKAEELNQLRKELDAQTAKTEELASALENNASEIERQNQALSESTSALQQSEDAAAKLAADLEKERIAAQTAAEDIARAEAKAEELNQLRKELDAQTAKTEELASALENNADEIDRQNQALFESTSALQASEGAAAKLAADLEKERMAAKIAAEDIAKAEAKAEELIKLREELDAQTAKAEQLAGALEYNTDEIDRQNQALFESTRALQESKDAAAKLAADLEKERIAAKEAREDIARAEAKAEELNQLRSKLDAQTAETEKLSSALENNADEVDRQNQALIESTKALQESETAAAKLAADLEKERIAAIDAEADIAKAMAKAEELSQLRNELDAQTAKTEELVSALDGNTDEINRQNQALIESTKALQESEEAANKLAADLEAERLAAKAAQSDIAKAEARAEELSHVEIELKAAVEDLASERSIADDREVLISEHVVQEVSRQSAPVVNRDLLADVSGFEQSVQSIPAYRTLKEYEPDTYNGMLTTFELLFEKGHTKQRIDDTLRIQQAELTERRIPRASSLAVLTYARLVVDQLIEFQTERADLCYKMLVPQASSSSYGSPIISELTRVREYEVLDITLRSYDADMTLPSEEDVWPDLEPIFTKLSEAHAGDYVSALFDPVAPTVDKVMTCYISQFIYSEILKLPEENAVNAFRWLLSP